MTKDEIGKAKNKKWFAAMDFYGARAGDQFDVNSLNDVQFSEYVDKGLIVSEQPAAAEGGEATVIIKKDKPAPSKNKAVKPRKSKKG